MCVVVLVSLLFIPTKIWDTAEDPAAKRSDVLEMPVDSSFRSIRSEDVVLEAVLLSSEDPSETDGMNGAGETAVPSSDPAPSVSDSIYETGVTPGTGAVSETDEFPEIDETNGPSSTESYGGYPESPYIQEP